MLGGNLTRKAARAAGLILLVIGTIIALPAVAISGVGGLLYDGAEG